jgi:hypothetical protein
MLVNHDAFAREELHRQRIYTTQTCQWCGCQRKIGSGLTYLFNYLIERDDRNGRRDEIKGLFCSTDCLKNYHS